jgi:hypothetical protein
MRLIAVVGIVGLTLAVGACGDSAKQPPAPKVGVVNAATAPADAKAEPAKEAKHEAPDTHGMPGMADLFMGEEKAEKK